MATPFKSPARQSLVAAPWFEPIGKLRIASTATTNATLVKAGPATLEALILFNKNAGARFMHFYDEAVAPTVGSDPVDWTLTLPPTVGTLPIVMHIGIPYFVGLAFSITSGLGDTDAGAVSADDVHGVLLFS